MVFLPPFISKHVSVSCSVMLTPCNSMDCGPPGSSAMRSSRQGYWSGLTFASPGYLLNPGIKPKSSAGLLPCKQILYQLSYKRSPPSFIYVYKKQNHMYLCIYAHIEHV